MTPLHVLMIPSWYPCKEDRIRGIYHVRLAEALAKQPETRCNILFVEQKPLRAYLADLFCGRRRAEEKRDGLTTFLFRCVDSARGTVAAREKRYLHALRRAFLRYCRKNGKPDVLHAQLTMPAGYAAARLGAEFRIPVVVTEHHIDLAKYFTPELLPYTKYVLSHSLFSVVSRSMQETLAARGYEVCLLPNMVDCSAFHCPHTADKSGIFRLATVCALREGKNVGDVIGAVKQLHESKRIAKIHLTIVGDGALRRRYEMETQILDAVPFVTFAGQKTGEQIAEILGKTDVLVIASDLEGFAVPGIEALAAGVPVVCTRCKGPEEFVTEETGVLCFPRDVPGMADAIYKVYQNIEKYKLENLQAMAARYDRRTVTQDALELYRRAIMQQEMTD